MLIYTNQKPKKRKSKTKKEIADYQEWLDRVNSMTTNFSNGRKIKTLVTTPKEPKLQVRETPNYPSLSSFVPGGGCTKPIQGKVYTGTAMKGIGTLHKSNAVPIFTDEEARDQAAMRR